MPDDPKPAPAPPAPAAETPPAVPDLGRLVEAAVAKHGDGTAALKAVIADLYSARDDLKAAQAKLPGEGSVVLTGEDAKNWGAYQGLGKPSDLRKTVDEHGALAGKVATFERDEVLRSVADRAKVKLAVLKTLAGAALAFEVVKAKDKLGKDVEVLHVKDPAGVAEGQPVPGVPFDEYAAKHWADFLPALRPEAAKPAAPGGSPSYAMTPPRPAITPIPPPARRVNSL